MTESRLYFGLGGTPGPDAFDEFVAEEVVTRLPEGFTIIAAQGAWASERAGGTIRETSRILVRVHEGDIRENAALEDIAAAYISRFGQESVLRTDTPVCGRF